MVEDDNTYPIISEYITYIGKWIGVGVMADILSKYEWPIIGACVILALLGYLIYIYVSRGRKAALSDLRETIYMLLLVAERKFGDKEEQKKEQWVLDKTYELMPAVLRKLITENELIKLIEYLLEDAIKLLDKEMDKIPDHKAGEKSNSEGS